MRLELFLWVFCGGSKWSTQPDLRHNFRGNHGYCQSVTPHDEPQNCYGNTPSLPWFTSHFSLILYLSFGNLWVNQYWWIYLEWFEALVTSLPFMQLMLAGSVRRDTNTTQTYSRYSVLTITWFFLVIVHFYPKILLTLHLVLLTRCTFVLFTRTTTTSS